MSSSTSYEINRARRKWFESYTDIVFMILSTIQGLAFGDLAQRTAKVIPFLVHSGMHWLDWSILLHTLLCYAIIIRLFQTYITVALDYDAEYASFADAVQIILTGLLQYCIIATIGVPGKEGFHPVFFYGYLTFLTFVAGLKYFLNILLIRRKSWPHADELRRETRLQVINGTFTMAIAVLSLLFWVIPSWRTAMGIINPIVIIGILVAQTTNSLYSTFGLRVLVRDKITSASPDSPVDGSPVLVHRDDMIVRDATFAHNHDSSVTDDSALIRSLLNKLVPELAEMFGVSRSRMLARLPTLVNARDGSVGLFGWKKWRVVADNRGRGIGAVRYFEPLEKMTLRETVGSLLYESFDVVDQDAAAGSRFVRTRLRPALKSASNRKASPVDMAKVAWQAKRYKDTIRASAEKMGYAMCFDINDRHLYALLLVTPLAKAADIADVILDFDYQSHVAGAGFLGVTFLIRDDIKLVEELNELTKPSYGAYHVEACECAQVVSKDLGIGLLHTVSVIRE